MIREYIDEQEGEQIADDLWNLIVINDALLHKTAALVRQLPAGGPLRAGDAIHLATAMEAGETEIWTNDRHLLAAAGCVGLTGKSVGVK